MEVVIPFEPYSLGVRPDDGDDFLGPDGVVVVLWVPLFEAKEGALCVAPVGADSAPKEVLPSDVVLVVHSIVDDVTEWVIVAKLDGRVEVGEMFPLVDALFHDEYDFWGGV